VKKTAEQGENRGNEKYPSQINARFLTENHHEPPIGETLLRNEITPPESSTPLVCSGIVK
jgi:hypothetical protein